MSGEELQNQAETVQLARRGAENGSQQQCQRCEDLELKLYVLTSDHQRTIALAEQLRRDLKRTKASAGNGDAGDGIHLETLQRDAASLLAHKGELEQKLTERDRQIVELKHDNECLAVRLQEETQALRSDLQDAQRTLAAEREQNAVLARAREVAENQVEVLRSDQDGLRAQLAELGRRHDDLICVHQTIEDQVEALRQGQDRLRAQLADEGDIRQKLERQLAEAAQYQKMVEGLQLEKQALRLDLQHAERAAGDQRQRSAATQQEMQARLTSSQETERHLQQQLNNQRREYEALKIAAQEVQEKLAKNELNREAAERTVAELNSAQNDLRFRLLESQQEMQAKLTNSQETERHLQQQLNDQGREYEALKSAAQGTREKLVESERNREAAERTVAELNSAQNDLRFRLLESQQDRKVNDQLTQLASNFFVQRQMIEHEQTRSGNGQELIVQARDALQQLMAQSDRSREEVQSRVSDFLGALDRQLAELSSTCQQTILDAELNRLNEFRTDLSRTNAALLSKYSILAADVGALRTLAQAGRGRGVEQIRMLYLDLLELALTGFIYDDEPISPWSKGYDPDIRIMGWDWPGTAHTMIGLARMRNIRVLAEKVIREKVKGDFLEAGIWRGGACIYMRGILAAHGIKNRKVWAADSFRGLPPPEPEAFPADAGDPHHTFSELAVPLSEVKKNFTRYNLLDDQVAFIPGWFKDTLPGAPVEKLSLLRLDGDMYESTTEILQSLYFKVSRGGFIIVDDYILEPCKKAVHDFRRKMKIRDPIHDVDGAAVYWRKG